MGPRPSAPFVPLSPTINIPQLLLTTPNFKQVPRIDAQLINSTNLEKFQAMIKEHVITNGIPLILENWHQRPDWKEWIFNPSWLTENHGTDRINVRDIPNKADIPMTMAHYLNNLKKLASKFTPSNYDSKHQRLYGKDLDCPPVWSSALSEILPSCTWYLAPQADLMSSLPPNSRAENLMCYIGHEGTYTPAHKEMCASLGQNIMVHTSKEGPDSEAGSSIWFMTEMADRDVVAEYWLGTLGHDIEVEAHFASLEDLRKAPFTVYIAEQRLGDYILIPPLAPHQVWNRGTSTIKVAWNRTTVDTLELAVAEALPKARVVCRDEQYKNKFIIYDTLLKYTAILTNNDPAGQRTAPASIKDDYIRLFTLFNNILLDECFSPLLPLPKAHLEACEYNVTCSFCRANIFNRFLSCKRCMPPTQDGDDDDPYDVCMECYASGRSCYCVSGLTWQEQYSWDSELLVRHEDFRQTVIFIQGGISADTPLKFSDALVRYPRKPLARVCQEALILRPYVDPEEEEEPDDAKDILRKKRTGELLTCHVCKVRHENWKCALCTSKNCHKAYCYGNLWRAFDMDPFKDVLAQYNWKCPFCLGICSCGACKKRDDMQPYVPKGTILGSVTKHVADPRSVETLVDFAKGNAVWVGGYGISGMKRKRSDNDEVNKGGHTLRNWSHTFATSNADHAYSEDAPGEETLNEHTTLVNGDDSTDSFSDDDNVMYEGAQNLFIANEDAAGIGVASIPIDPSLQALDGDSSHLNVMSANYAKLFEAPPPTQNQTNLNDNPTFRKRRPARPGSYGYLNDSQDTLSFQQGNDEEAEHSPSPPVSLRNDINISSRSHVNNGTTNEALPLSTAMLVGTSSPRRHTEGIETQNIHSRHDRTSSTGFQEQHPLSVNLSTLEKNPLAFLAAAGLMESRYREENGIHSSSHEHHENQYPITGYISDPNMIRGANANGTNHGIQEHMAIQASSNDQTPRRTNKKDRVTSDMAVEHYVESAQTALSEWVKQAKRRSHKKRRTGSLIVTLRISPDAWKRWNAEIAKKKEDKAMTIMKKLGDTDVGTDLSADVNGTRIAHVVENHQHTSKSTKGKSRSRKNQSDWSDGDDDELYVQNEVLPKKDRRSLRTGDLVEGLTYTPRKRSLSQTQGSISPTTRRTRGGLSIVQKSMKRQSVVENDSDLDMQDDEEVENDVNAQVERELAIENSDEQNDMLRTDSIAVDDQSPEYEDAMLHMVNSPSNTMSAGSPAVSKAQSDINVSHDSPKNPLAVTTPQVAPDMQPSPESESDPEDDVLVPGTAAYKEVIARAMRAAKDAALREVEADLASESNAASEAHSEMEQPRQQTTILRGFSEPPATERTVISAIIVHKRPYGWAVDAGYEPFVRYNTYDEARLGHTRAGKEPRKLVPSRKLSKLSPATRAQNASASLPQSPGFTPLNRRQSSSDLDSNATTSRTTRSKLSGGTILHTATPSTNHSKRRKTVI